MEEKDIIRVQRQIEKGIEKSIVKWSVNTYYSLTAKYKRDHPEIRIDNTTPRERLWKGRLWSSCGYCDVWRTAIGCLYCPLFREKYCAVDAYHIFQEGKPSQTALLLQLFITQKRKQYEEERIELVAKMMEHKANSRELAIELLEQREAEK